MKLKKLMLPFLLMNLAVNPIFSQESTNKNANLENLFNLDYSKSYTATDVYSLLDTVLTASDNQIEESYKEGYKQGCIEFKSTAETYQKEYEELKKLNVIENICFVSAGFLVGFCSGVVIMSIAN